MNDKHCCLYKQTPRDEETLRLYKNRLNRMIGQLTGIQKMLDEQRYCGDILTQIAAVESALQSLGYLIMEEHLNTCVKEQVLSGNDQVLGEALSLIRKLK